MANNNYLQLYEVLKHSEGLPRWLSGKESACRCKRYRRCGFDPQVGKLPWRRKWQPTPVFFPAKSHGQRSLVGYSPYGHKESDMIEELINTITCMFHFFGKPGLILHFHRWGSEGSVLSCWGHTADFWQGRGFVYTTRNPGVPPLSPVHSSLFLFSP